MCDATLRVGAHISSAKGYRAMGEHALRLGANTFAFFTRNPRGGRAKALDPADIAAFTALADANHFAPIVAHASYTINPCSAKESVRDFARETMADDLLRLANTPGCYYNFHPGGNSGQTTDACIAEIAALLNAIIAPDCTTTLLIETMAWRDEGAVGGQFEDMRAILDQVRLPEKLGVCLDICHVWAAGYDIVDDLDGVLTRFDRIVGLDKLHVIHSNDSLGALGAGLDRHARLGEGTIGRDAIARIVRHPALRDKVFILETPNDDAGWSEEIVFLRRRHGG